MRRAWPLGVLLFLAPGGELCASLPTPRDLSAMLHSGELPPIGVAPGLPRPRRSRPPAPTAVKPLALPAPLVPHPVLELERLGEELRDAVRPAPTLDGFLRAIRDPEPAGREAALEAFGYDGNFAAIPYVSAVLLRLDEQLGVRVAAVRALGRIGDRRARSFLARALRDGEPAVRLASAAALDRIRAAARRPGGVVRGASLP